MNVGAQHVIVFPMFLEANLIKDPTFETEFKLWSSFKTDKQVWICLVSLVQACETRNIPVSSI